MKTRRRLRRRRLLAIAHAAAAVARRLRTASFGIEFACFGAKLLSVFAAQIDGTTAKTARLPPLLFFCFYVFGQF